MPVCIFPSPSSSCRDMAAISGYVILPKRLWTISSFWASYRGSPDGRWDDKSEKSRILPVVAESLIKTRYKSWNSFYKLIKKSKHGTTTFQARLVKVQFLFYIIHVILPIFLDASWLISSSLILLSRCRPNISPCNSSQRKK
jgi:hypothetical protein